MSIAVALALTGLVALLSALACGPVADGASRASARRLARRGWSLLTLSAVLFVAAVWTSALGVGR